MLPTSRDQCPVCSSRLESPWSFTRNIYVNYPRCGLFGLTHGAERTLQDSLTTSPKAAVLSYGIHKTPRPTGPVSPSASTILPSVTEVLSRRARLTLARPCA